MLLRLVCAGLFLALKANISVLNLMQVATGSHKVTSNLDEDGPQVVAKC